MQVSALFFLNVKGPLVFFQWTTKCLIMEVCWTGYGSRRGVSLALSVRNDSPWTQKSELYHPWRGPILNHERHAIWNYNSASPFYSLSDSFHTCSLTIYYIHLDSCETWRKFSLDPNGLKRRSLDPGKSSRCVLSFESGCGSKSTSAPCIYLNKEDWSRSYTLWESIHLFPSHSSLTGSIINLCTAITWTLTAWE